MRRRGAGRGHQQRNRGTSFTVQAQALSPSFSCSTADPSPRRTERQPLYGTVSGACLVGPKTLYPSSAPAQPDEIIVLYANGFGATNAPVQSGSVTQSGTLSPLPLIKIGDPATVQFAGLSAVGEFQFGVVVPANTPDEDQSITATYGGLTTQAGTLITIQH